jgi:glycosyltransferase involved in cell wall biosynthesis
MACALPVVATRVGGNPELVDDGSTGRLVPSQNNTAMAAAIMQYFDDPAMARRHGGAARSAVVRRFSLERMVQDYRTLYDGLRKRRPAMTARAGASD